MSKAQSTVKSGRTVKPGRTLVVTMNDDEVPKFGRKDVVNTHRSDKGTHFCEFSSIETAQKVYEKLSGDKNVKSVRYSDYQVFFRITSGETNDVEYDDVKAMIVDSLKDKVDGCNIKYFKLHKNRETKKLTGTGDLVFDRISDQQFVLNREDGETAHSEVCGDYTLSFYPYRRQPRGARSGRGGRRAGRGGRRGASASE